MSVDSRFAAPASRAADRLMRASASLSNPLADFRGLHSDRVKLCISRKSG